MSKPHRMLECIVTSEGSSSKPSLIPAFVAVLLAFASAWWAVAACVYGYQFLQSGLLDESTPEGATTYALSALICLVASALGFVGVISWWRNRIRKAVILTFASCALVFGLLPLL